MNKNPLQIVFFQTVCRYSILFPVYILWTLIQNVVTDFNYYFHIIRLKLLKWHCATRLFWRNKSICYIATLVLHTIFILHTCHIINHPSSNREHFKDLLDAPIFLHSIDSVKLDVCSQIKHRSSFIARKHARSIQTAICNCLSKRIYPVLAGNRSNRWQSARHKTHPPLLIVSVAPQSSTNVILRFPGDPRYRA